MDRKIQSIELEKTVEDIERSIELKQSDRHEKNYIHPPRTQIYIYIINVNFSTVVIKNVDQKRKNLLDFSMSKESNCSIITSFPKVPCT